MKALPLIALCVALVACDKPSVPTATQSATQTDHRSPSLPANPSRRVIDTHTHLNRFSYEVYLNQVAQTGVVRVVNMSGGSSQEVRAENLAAAERLGGRIALFHNIDWGSIDAPDFADREAEALEISIRSGFAGVKVSKALGLGVRTADGALVTVDDPRLDPIWAKAGQLGVPVAIHTSDPKAFFEPPTPDNERYAELSLAPGWSFYGDQFPSREALLAARDRLIARHPETTFILLHFANNPEDVAYVDRLLNAHANVLVDVAARIGEIGRHDPELVRAIFERHQDRILFATDLMMGIHPGPQGQARLRLTLGSISEQPPGLDDVAPFYQTHFDYFEMKNGAIDHPVPIQGPWKVRPIGLPTAISDKIYWGNAERLITAPWLARSTGRDVLALASRLASDE